MKLPESESMVRSFLLGHVTVPVSTKVPANRPESFVRAWRSGGVATNRVLDEVIITVQAWGPDSVTASGLASDCRHAFLNDYTSMPLVRGVEEVSAPYFDPDAVSGVDRYTASYRLFVRAKR